VKEIIINLLNKKIVHLSVRFILGGVFIYASIDKIAFPKEFTRIVINYHILPENIAAYFAFLLPWIDLFLGIFLIVGIFVRESALALSPLLLVFIAACIIESINRTLYNCSCLSARSANSENIFILICSDTFYLLCGLFVFTKEHKMRTVQSTII